MLPLLDANLVAQRMTTGKLLPQIMLAMSMTKAATPRLTSAQITAATRTTPACLAGHIRAMEQVAWQAWTKEMTLAAIGSQMNQPSSVQRSQPCGNEPAAG